MDTVDNEIFLTLNQREKALKIFEILQLHQEALKILSKKNDELQKRIEKLESKNYQRNNSGYQPRNKNSEEIPPPRKP